MGPSGAGSAHPHGEQPPMIERLDPAVLRQQLIASDDLAGRRPNQIRVVRAPGRVNLIGEHTDYNDGLVLPAAISAETWIVFVPSDDRRVELTLAASGERASFHLDALGAPRHDWIDYAVGVAWSLGECGVSLRGLRGLVATTLPLSAGLSSSAALELAAAWALCDANAPPLEGMALARAAQRAENEYVGVQCGLMDQFASGLGRAGCAMLLDCRSLAYRAVSLPLREHALVAIDSGSPRRLEGSEYNARRAQCEMAVATLAARDQGIRALRDVDLAMLDSLANVLDATTLRRCEHVVRENIRVLETVRALEVGDLTAVGRYFAESHASLRDLYEVSSPALDTLVEIAASVEGVVAARMTGAGFGGSTVNLVRRDAIERLRDTIQAEYPRRTGLEPRFYPIEPVDGAGRLERAS